MMAQASAAGKTMGLLVMNASWREQVDAAGDTPPGAPSARTPMALWLTALAPGSAFTFALMLLKLRVSMPEGGTLWRLYDTPSDAVRLALAVGVCIWLAIQLFKAPK